MNKKLFGTLLMGSLVMGGTFVSCQDYDDEIADLQSQINDLKGLKTEVEGIKGSLGISMSQCQDAINAAIKAIPECDAKKALAEAAAAAEAAQKAAAAAAAAAEKGGDAQAAADKAQAAADAANKLAEAAQAAADAAAKTAETAGLDEAAVKAIADAQIKAAKLATVAALDKKANEILAELKKKQDAGKYLTAADLADLQAKVDGLKCEAVDLIGKRLTSLVFAPSTYVNGIEAIQFVNLNYRDWSTDPSKWLNDNSVYTNAWGGEVWNQVDDFGAKVEYFVSPEGVTMDGIKEVKFLLNDAKNTRANTTAEAKDVELKFIEDPTIDPETGKLVGYVKKEFKNKKTHLPEANDGDHGTESLIIASLKATIADDLKTEDEKDQEVAVFSDWVRLDEGTGIPRIHRKSSTPANHFNAFSAIYRSYDRVADDIIKDNSKKSATDAVYKTEGTTPTVKQFYKDPLDLMSLVTVCYGDEKIIADYARYGFAFEFNLLDFNLQNLGETKDFTNQKQFATLEGTTLTSRAENGLTNNKNAVGRKPVVQIVLKDTNKNAVVDVRYTMVEWVDESIETNPWTKVFEKVAPWMCSNKVGDYYLEDYKVYILEEEMNDFYATIVTGGINKAVFFAQYQELSDIYLGELTDDVKAAILSQDANNGDIKVGNTLYTSIGKASWKLDDATSVKTQNVELNFNFINPRVDDENPKDGEDRGDKAQAEQNFSKDGYFWFVSADGTNRIFVPVKINVKKGSYEYAATKEPAQWNTAKTSRVMNPQLMSDEVYGSKNATTTQMIGSLAAGYVKYNPATKKYDTPDITDLVNYVQYDEVVKLAESDIVFDGGNIASLPTRKTEKKYGADNKVKDCAWHIEANGKELWLGYNTNASTPWLPANWVENYLAAKIVDNNIYLTDTADDTKGAEYKTAAKTEDMLPNVASLLLVGQKIPVKVVAKNCEFSDFESYSVEYLTPLKFSGISDVLKVYDITNNGSTATFTINSIKLQECFGNNSRSIYIVKPVEPAEPVAPVKDDYIDGLTKGTAKYDAAIVNFEEDSVAYKKVILPAYAAQLKVYQSAVAAYTDATNEALMKWYGVQTLTVDTKKAKTDLLTPGKFNTTLGDILGENGEKKYALNAVDVTGKITDVPGEMAAIKFENLSGNAIQQTINIRIPVSVDTKWQKASTLQGVIEVSIIPTYNNYK